MILNIPVTKAGNATVEIDPNDAPENMFKAIVEAGCKVLINGGAGEITHKNYPDEEKFKKAAMNLAETRVLQLMEGTLKLGRGTAVKGPSGPVMTEARRLAREVVKTVMKSKGYKVSHYSQSEITLLANELLKEDPGYIVQATANIEARKNPPKMIDLSKARANPELVAKAEEAKARKKSEKLPGGLLSAAQAGRTAPRPHAAH